VDFQRDLKAKREKSSFGSKEGLMQISVSGSKSKERGFKIFRGIVRHKDRRAAFDREALQASIATGENLE
jgi:hypothetical protein